MSSVVCPYHIATPPRATHLVLFGSCGPVACCRRCALWFAEACKVTVRELAAGGAA